jgi:CheY-like chemotaxis protein
MEKDFLNILFIDDDKFDSMNYITRLRDSGFHVKYMSSAINGLFEAERNRYTLIIVDIMMPKPKNFSIIETAGGYKTGIALTRRLIENGNYDYIVGLTNSTDRSVYDYFEKQNEFRCFCKRTTTPDDFLKIVNNLVRGIFYMPKVFIVHGHDQTMLLELKNYLQNKLKLPEPIILSEKPSSGLTVIEKFEKFSGECDIAMIMMTPDDLVDDSKPMRARQNVLFEFGYFLGSFKRKSGKVILLYKGNTDIPTDLSGLIYIDITNGINAAGEQIRTELNGLFPDYF